MKKLKQAVIAGTATVSLASCGGANEDSSATKTPYVKVASSDWDATDACALLDKAAMGAALKDNVTETSLDLVNEASGPNAATSECNYMLASGSKASLMTRRSPIDDNTAEAIAMARKAGEATVAAFGHTVEDVPSLGKAAFFVPGINQMTVFIDDNKFVVLTISSAQNETAKATATELVKQIGN